MELITELCRNPIPQGKRNKGSGGGNGGSIEIDDENEYDEKPYSSLKQILEDQIWMYKPDDLMGRIKASDCMLTHSWGLDVINRCGNILGDRLIHCSYDRFNMQEHIIIYKMFDYYKNYSVRFGLMSFSNGVFNATLKKYIKMEEINGKSKWTVIARESLIAGEDWTLIDKNRCKKICQEQNCGNCIGMYHSTIFNIKQIATIK